MKPPHRLDVVQEVVFQERHCNCCILMIAQDASAVSNLFVFPPLVSQWGQLARHCHSANITIVVWEFDKF